MKEWTDTLIAAAIGQASQGNFSDALANITAAIKHETKDKSMPQHPSQTIICKINHKDYALRLEDLPKLLAATDLLREVKRGDDYRSWEYVDGAKAAQLFDTFQVAEVKAPAPAAPPSGLDFIPVPSLQDDTLDEI